MENESIITITIVIGLIIPLIIFVWIKCSKVPLSLPPCAPSSMWHTFNQRGFDRITHIHSNSMWCEKNTNQKTDCGTVFRFSFPMLQYLVICCDYKLARIVLAGSSDDTIKESEKTKRIEALNFFPDVCSLLTYVINALHNLS